MSDQEHRIIRLAIIGSGGIAQTHAEAIRLLPEARLTAVCSRNPAKAAQLAAPAGARAFASVEELLSSGEADAVLVATPSGAHLDAVLPALKKGHHVLCEKPLEVTTERVARLIAEADKSQRILAGFFPLRCGIGAQAIRAAVEQGRYGRITFLSARVKWWRDADYYRLSSWRGRWDLDGGGALMNQGIHAVDLLQWIGGLPIEASAFAATLAHSDIEVEDTLAAALRFSSGALGTIEAATSCNPGLDLSLEVSGDRGTTVLMNDKIVDWRFSEELPGDADIRSGRGSGAIFGGASDPKAVSCEGHRQQIEAFCRAIRGEAAEVISGREAARAVAVVESIYRSVRSGRSEPVILP